MLQNSRIRSEILNKPRVESESAKKSNKDKAKSFDKENELQQSMKKMKSPLKKKNVSVAERRDLLPPVPHTRSTLVLIFL